MAYWETPLDMMQLGRRRWILHRPLIAVSDIAGRLVVPADFIFDGASVPRLPFLYLLAGNRAWGPAAVHDFGYQRQLFGDRELNDRVFYELMGVHQPADPPNRLWGFERESEAIRRLMYRGVRVGGWKAWAEHAERAGQLNPEWTALGWPGAPVVEAP